MSLVAGNVMVVPSVPSKVSVLLTVKTLALVRVNVPEVEVSVKPLYVFPVNAWDDERSTKVTVPAGNVALVVFVAVRVSENAPDVVKASAKDTVLALATVSVPVVVDTVSPLYVLPVSAWLDAKSTKVTVPAGIVAFVVLVTVKVSEKAPEVANALAKVTFFVAARVRTSVPANAMELVARVVVSETVSVLPSTTVTVAPLAGAVKVNLFILVTVRLCADWS